MWKIVLKRAWLYTEGICFWVKEVIRFSQQQWIFVFSKTFEGACTLMRNERRWSSTTSMRNKPDKYGIKIFWCCDVENGFAFNCSIYFGRQKDEPLVKDLAASVKERTQPLRKGEYNISVDIFLRSYSQSSCYKKLTLLRISCQNTKEIPNELKT